MSLLFAGYMYISLQSVLLILYIYVSNLSYVPVSYISGTNLDEFDEQDVKRIRHDDLWLSRFLRSRKQEVNEALPALVSFLGKIFTEAPQIHASISFCFSQTNARGV